MPTHFLLTTKSDVMMKKLMTTGFILGLAILSLNTLAADAAACKAKAAMCAGCHGADGNSSVPANPKLNGQNEKYIAKQLKDFTTPVEKGGRFSPIMGGMAAGLSEADRANLAAHFSSQKVNITAAPAVSDEDLAIGERIYRGGNEATGVPACIACHAPKGNGNAPAGWPRLAGQHADYVVTQLQQFRIAAQYPDDISKGRRNDGDSKIMRDVTARMTDREISAVAAYVQGLH
jgi:cytochrome c553